MSLCIVVNVGAGEGVLVGHRGCDGVNACDDGCVLWSSDEVVFDLLFHVVLAVVFGVCFVDV